MKRIFGRVFTLTAERGYLLPGSVSMENRPRGGGAGGEGGGGDGSPRPCLDVSLKTSLAGSPPPPGRSAASSRPRKGAGSAWRLSRIQCTGEHERDLWRGVHVDGRERIGPLTLCRWGIATRGGADGEGGGGDGSPLPCLDVSLKTSLAGSPPPPGRSAASGLPPLKGAGSAWR